MYLQSGIYYELKDWNFLAVLEGIVHEMSRDSSVENSEVPLALPHDADVTMRLLMDHLAKLCHVIDSWSVCCKLPVALTSSFPEFA